MNGRILRAFGPDERGEKECPDWRLGGGTLTGREHSFRSGLPGYCVDSRRLGEPEEALC